MLKVTTKDLIFFIAFIKISVFFVIKFSLITSFQFFIKHGADANKKNHDGKTPLDLVKEGFPDVADLLRGDVALLEAAKKGTLAKVTNSV